MVFDQLEVDQKFRISPNGMTFTKMEVGREKDVPYNSENENGEKYETSLALPVIVLED